MTLSRTFEAVAYKQLVACDLPRRHSHQHELTGVRALRSILGTASKTQGRLMWVFFPEREQPVSEEIEFTYYDARARSAQRTGRSEWRLYYHGDFLGCAAIGDLLVLAKTRTRGLLGMIFAKTSEAYGEAVALFGLGETASFDTLPAEYLETREWNGGETPVLARWFRARQAR